MAKGAAEAVFQKLKNPDNFPESPMHQEGNVYVIPFDSGEARVRTETLIDLNGADDKVLGAVFDSMGIDPATRDGLVDSILDWRDADDVSRPNGAEVNDYGGASAGNKPLPYNAPFNSMQELMLVKHMTPDIYFGHITFDPSTNQHQKTVGLRDIATAGSGISQIDANSATLEVLAAIPGMSRDLASSIVAARQQKPFADQNDLFNRVPQLNDSEARNYLIAQPGFPNVLVSTATVQPSGTSKTIRFRLKTKRQKKIIQPAPLLFRDVAVLDSGTWEY